jgi:hypothetical protein
MPDLELHLIPTPGAKPEFLATVETPCLALPSKIVLEGYTRDAWAWKPHSAWQNATISPTTPKATSKLSGFVTYLKERNKCAYGRFSQTALLVISYIQSSSSSASSNNNTVTCRFTLDATEVPNCNVVKPKLNQKPSANTAALPKQQATSKRKKSGILGNLLGAQERTEHCMDVTHVKKSTASTDATTNATTVKTAQEVLTAFRNTMQEKMLNFEMTSDNVLPVQLSLANMTRELQGDDRSKVTMQILKFIVNEQAEEVNEDWICHSEPSEFMDEIVISVYKEAPPDVLEEVNKVELPEEVVGQQRAIQEARQRAVAKQEADRDKQLQQMAMQEDKEEEMATLNVHKRDRRTIEEIQLEKMNSNGSSVKRARLDES